MSAKTQALIRDTARDLGFRTNPSARALPTGRTNTIGVVVSNMTNPVMFELVRDMHRAAEEHGYTVILAESEQGDGHVADRLDRILAAVDGAILTMTDLVDERIQELSEARPVVLVNRRVQGVPDVAPDLRPAVRRALAELHDRGHRSVAYLSAAAGWWASEQRWDLLMPEALALGMSIIEIGPNEPDRGGGAVTLPRVRASGATAVITFNDLMAIGVLDAIGTEGGQVPKDLSIVSFDNMFGSDFTSPPLTTIDTRRFEIGEAAMHRLIGIIGPSEDMGPPAHEPIIGTLVVRGSVGPGPAAGVVSTRND
ncbi:LacI family DNA-binding transcriptional regulator [Occultella kanbiaonis]|uniref:LacI family DNA-binding transcriptional regulator n=1 Tax=Occultella kanbiaonis TaxID=2675754 RepID=UPI0022A898B2|nr:LacI family DNA-binding transcriptional regulator [Occultella kanbiaonis]